MTAPRKANQMFGVYGRPSRDRRTMLEVLGHLYGVFNDYEKARDFRKENGMGLYTVIRPVEL